MSCIWCHNVETIDPKPAVVWFSVKCIGAQACVRACPKGVLRMTPDGLRIDREKCDVCGICEDACPTSAVKVIGKVWSSDDLVQELLRDKVFFETSKGGVTLSGGEATYQAKFTLELAKGLQSEGVHVALDTCGCCSKKVLNDLLPHVDMVLFDMKIMDPEKHKEYTGVPLDIILENARTIAKSKKPVWIRTPVIPAHTDAEDNIRAIVRFIVENIPTVERYDLLAFNRTCVNKYALFDKEYPLKNCDLMTNKIMEHLAQISRKEGLSNVMWSGMTKNSKKNESVVSQ